MAQFSANYNQTPVVIPQVNDELFFETYVKSQETESNDLPPTTVHHSDELKCNLAMILNLKKNLESLKCLLSQNNLNDEEVCRQKQLSNDLKAQMEYLLDEMKSNKMCVPVQKKVPHRVKKKKRNRSRKSKLECKQIKSCVKSKVGKKKPILKDDVENLCRTNDMRLSEIISKKNDAQKYLNFLQDVVQLRKAKLAKAKNEINEEKQYSDESNAEFERKIDELKAKWIKLMNEYTAEERSLKEMMKEDGLSNSSNSAKLHYWERLLFGDDICRTHYDSLDENYKKYYALLRCMWDESIDTSEGSNLPLGWVMPQEPSHPAWKEYCQNELS